MSCRWQRLLQRKDDVHYGLTVVDRSEAKKLVGYAKRMVDNAQRVLES